MTGSESPAVRAELNFLDPRSTLRRHFIAPGARIATERTEKHPVTIRDDSITQIELAVELQCPRMNCECPRCGAGFGSLVDPLSLD